MTHPTLGGAGLRIAPATPVSQRHLDRNILRHGIAARRHRLAELETSMVEACERAAGSAGFTRLEMGATLTGVPFYRARGYEELEAIEVPLENGVTMPIVRMGKRVPINRLKTARG